MSQEELLGYREAGEFVGYAPGTLRNLVARGELKRNVHYLKPLGKVQFIRSALVEWLRGEEPSHDHDVSEFCGKGS